MYITDIFVYNGKVICPNCYDDYYTVCYRCHNILLRADAYYDDDNEYYCEECYNKFHPLIINSYTYKPNPVFFGSGIHYGIELEVDCGGCDSCNASQILDIANECNDYIYIKEDGSLVEGFEIVSYPISLDFHLTQVPWDKILKGLIELGYLSHNTETCGYHIHVGRDCFGVSEDEQNECISKILYFMEDHWDILIKFSRRTSYSIKKWANKYNYELEPSGNTVKHIKSSNMPRYYCLNLQNDKTIEFRIFRGTLKLNTFLATIQLVDEICLNAINLSADEIKELMWDKFVQSIDFKKKKELKIYLKEKGLYCDVEGENN